jgi:nucleoid DNA-binding protein
MTTVEMIHEIGERTGFQNKDVERILDLFVKNTQDALKTGQKVSLTGLGTFTPKDKPARIARNPKTGARVEVKAKKVIKFKPGKELTEVLNGKNNTAGGNIEKI